MLANEQTDLLVLCDTLSMEERGRAIAFTNSWPTMTSVILTGGACGCDAQMLEIVLDSLSAEGDQFRAQRFAASQYLLHAADFSKSNAAYENKSKVIPS
jgi:hypothetical protein